MTRLIKFGLTIASVVQLAWIALLIYVGYRLFVYIQRYFEVLP